MKYSNKMGVKGMNIVLVMILVLIAISCNGCSIYGIPSATKKFGERNMKLLEIKKKPLDGLKGIYIDTQYADIFFEKSNEFAIECHFYYIENKPIVRVKDNKLIFCDEESIPDNYSIQLSQPNYIKVYIPTEEIINHVMVCSLNGDIQISDIDSKKIEIDNSYGDVSLTNSSVEEATVTLSNGDLSMHQSWLQEAVITNSYGDIQISKWSQEQELLNTVDDLKSSVHIYSSNGQVGLTNVQTENLDIENKHGDVTLSDITVKKLNCNLKNGDCYLNNLISEETKIVDKYGNIAVVNYNTIKSKVEVPKQSKISVSLLIGILTLDDVKADKMALKNDFGNLNGEAIYTSQLEGIFDSGKCMLTFEEIVGMTLENTFGNILVNLPGCKADYNYNITSKSGTILMKEEMIEKEYRSNTNKKKKVSIATEDDISIQFEH